MDTVLDFCKKKIGILVDLLFKSPKESLQKEELVTYFSSEPQTVNYFGKKTQSKIFQFYFVHSRVLCYKTASPEIDENLTHFWSMLQFYTPFLVLSGYLKW